MAKNTNPSLLDAPQLVKRAFDDDNDSFRMVLGEAQGISIELSADDGDSITNVPESSTANGSLTAATTGVIVAEASCYGAKSAQIYSKTLTTITTPPTLTIQVSPLDTGDVWFSTSTTLVPGTVIDNVAASSIGSICARRIRVSTSAATASGTATVYLVVQAI
jgi:hypothetical protein